jgi:hypothetical protein
MLQLTITSKQSLFWSQIGVPMSQSALTIKCSQCNATLHPTGKTTRLRCRYCNGDNVIDPATLAALAAQGPVAPPEDLEKVRVALGGVLDHPQNLLDALARRLKNAFPETQIEAAGFFSKGHAAKVTTQIGDWSYELSVSGHKLLAKQAHTVKGVALKRKELSVEELLHAIAAELYELSVSADPKVFDRFMAG